MLAANAIVSAAFGWAIREDLPVLVPVGMAALGVSLCAYWFLMTSTAWGIQREILDAAARLDPSDTNPATYYVKRHAKSDGTMVAALSVVLVFGCAYLAAFLWAVSRIGTRH